VDITILEDLNFTFDQNKRLEDELKLAHEKEKYLKSKKKIEHEIMQLKLHIANIVDDYKNKTNGKRLKVRRI
jgi:hypothetical protein